MISFIIVMAVITMAILMVVISMALWSVAILVSIVDPIIINEDVITAAKFLFVSMAILAIMKAPTGLAAAIVTIPV